mmetsp:Transcript_7006/g.21865  ORF Transcript_7006/g.21865 Transcript_7006/m.21865 type:complete len:266 (+) Transcript_7006:701-1498(+)
MMILGQLDRTLLSGSGAIKSSGTAPLLHARSPPSPAKPVMLRLGRGRPSALAVGRASASSRPSETCRSAARSLAATKVEPSMSSNSMRKQWRKMRGTMAESCSTCAGLYFVSPTRGWPMKAMCTRIWCVLPVRIRICTSVNQRPLPQKLVLPFAGTHHCLRALYLVTAGRPSFAQMTLPNSRREKSCHFFIGTSMRPTSGPSGGPRRPSTRARYSFCIRWAEFCTVKCRKASHDLPKICTPLVWLSRRWQMPRCRGSLLLGISKR